MTSHTRGSGKQLDYFALPIVDLAEAPDMKVSDPTQLDAARSEANRGSISHAGAAEDCLQEECSVDTVPRSAEHRKIC